MKKLLLLLCACVVMASGVLIAEPRYRHLALSELLRRVPALRETLTKPAEPVEVALKAAGFELGAPTVIRIFKNEALLEVWMKRGETFALFKSYPICRFSGDLGPKIREGDREAPEGYYFVSAKQLLPTSKHHRAFNTGFPNAYDRALGRTGTVLMIHGDCASIGCYAMTDPAIDEIYKIVEASITTNEEPVALHLYPFRMTDKNLAKYKDHQWADYWNNLAEGYRLFEQARLPPTVQVCEGRYHFGKDAANCEPVMAW
jgi:murein L,D-transpeptidase YafK